MWVRFSILKFSRQNKRHRNKKKHHTTIHWIGYNRAPILGKVLFESCGCLNEIALKTSVGRWNAKCFSIILTNQNITRRSDNNCIPLAFIARNVYLLVNVLFSVTSPIVRDRCTMSLNEDRGHVLRIIKQGLIVNSDRWLWPQILLYVSKHFCISWCM